MNDNSNSLEAALPVVIAALGVNANSIDELKVLLTPKAPDTNSADFYQTIGAKVDAKDYELIATIQDGDKEIKVSDNALAAARTLAATAQLTPYQYKALLKKTASDDMANTAIAAAQAIEQTKLAAAEKLTNDQAAATKLVAIMAERKAILGDDADNKLAAMKVAFGENNYKMLEAGGLFNGKDGLDFIKKWSEAAADPTMTRMPNPTIENSGVMNATIQKMQDEKQDITAWVSRNQNSHSTAEYKNKIARGDQLRNEIAAIENKLKITA